MLSLIRFSVKLICSFYSPQPQLFASIMSISWAKLCADAEAKSLQALLNGNYAMGGILVRF
jgi:hypothetical protein